MGEQALATLDVLRARIREIEGHRVQRERVSSGVAAIDRLVGGLPTPGMLELSGSVGHGATRLAAGLAAQASRHGQPVVWVDGRRELYPPALQALGVPLERLLVLQPSADRLGWAVEQAARSGAAPLVIAAGVPRIGRHGPRWAHAVEEGGCCLVALTRRVERALPAEVRLAVGERAAGLTVVRQRGGRVGAQSALPAWPEPADPWFGVGA